MIHILLTFHGERGELAVSVAGNFHRIPLHRNFYTVPVTISTFILDLPSVPASVAYLEMLTDTCTAIRKSYPLAGNAVANARGVQSSTCEYARSSGSLPVCNDAPGVYGNSKIQRFNICLQSQYQNKQLSDQR